eukprot:4011093-Pleurochrysis_carterae.AAC.1
MRTWSSLVVQGAARRSEARHKQCVAQLKQRLLGRVVAVAIGNITRGNAQDDGADELDGQSHTVSNFAAHARVALRCAVGREEYAIAACRACRAAVNKSPLPLRTPRPV